MPIFMEVDRLRKVVTIVAHGTVSNEDILGKLGELADAKVPSFAKIIDTSAAMSYLSPEQMEDIASVLRDEPDPRGPVAYVVSPDRPGFARAHAEATIRERPIKLFTSLHEARRWIAEELEALGKVPKTAVDVLPQ